MTLLDRRRPRAAARQFRLDAVIVGLGFLNGGVLAAACGDGSVALVAADPSHEPVSVRPHEEQAALLAMAVDSDGGGILTGGDDGRLMRTDGAGRTSVVATFPGRQVDVIAVSPAAGLRAAAAGRELRLLDRQGQVLAATTDHPSTVTGLAFNPRGKRLAAAHYGAVTLWWTGSLGRNPARLAWAGSHIAVSWSPDGAVVMSSLQGNELHGWRLADGRDMRMDGYAAKIRSMAWLARPLTLLTGGSDGVIGWKFTAGGPMGKPPVEIGLGIGHLVTSVSIHPRLPLVAAGFDDGRVAICSVDGEKTVRLRPGDGERIAALAWSPDGATLAAGTEAGSLSLLDIDPPG